MPPSVALESTVIAHGLPEPDNLETARALEHAVQDEGATPHTIGCIDGRPVVGLSDAQIHRLATGTAVRKVSLRDLPVVCRPGGDAPDGATTVAATMHLAHRADIPVVATGGIGGVHRTLRSAPAWDVSADLEALRRISLAVVCSGPKLILDLSATREVLESYGVTVVGYKTDQMPAFYSASSEFPVDVRCDTPAAVADVVRSRAHLDLQGATLVTVPPPDDHAIPRSSVEPAIDTALEEAAARELDSAAVTPFLLRRLRELEGDRIVDANRALLLQNARVATRIAHALSEAG